MKAARVQLLRHNRGPWTRPSGGSGEAGFTHCRKVPLCRLDHFCLRRLLCYSAFPVRNNRGNAYAKEKDYDCATADYTEAIWLDPNYAAALYWRGKAKQLKGDIAGGDADIAATKRINPNVGN